MCNPCCSKATMTVRFWIALTTVLATRQTDAFSYCSPCQYFRRQTQIFGSLLPDNNKNPSLSRWIGDMASAVFSRNTAVVAAANNPGVVDDAALDCLSPSLNVVVEELQKQQTPEERKFRSINLAYGYGVGSPLHKLRLFDESNREEDVRVTFYRDSASWWYVLYNAAGCVFFLGVFNHTVHIPVLTRR